MANEVILNSPKPQAESRGSLLYSINDKAVYMRVEVSGAIHYACLSTGMVYMDRPLNCYVVQNVTIKTAEKKN